MAELSKAVVAVVEVLVVFVTCQVGQYLQESHILLLSVAAAQVEFQVHTEVVMVLILLCLAAVLARSLLQAVAVAVVLEKTTTLI